MSIGSNNETAEKKKESQSSICPKCTKPTEVFYKKRGFWKVFDPQVICSSCKNDISKEFSLSVATPKKNKTLTIALKKAIREQKIKKAIFVDGKTKTEACRLAGYAESTARSKSADIVSDIVEKSGGIEQILNYLGVSKERLVRKIDEGLDATKVISANVIIGNEGDPADERDGMKEANGVTKDFIDVPDFMARHKYVETGLKLHGLLQTNVKVDGDLMLETYEARRKRLGLDDMPAEEVLRRLKEQKRLLEEAK